MKTLFYLFSVLLFISCSRNENENPKDNNPKILEIKGADISFLPELRQYGATLYNRSGQQEDLLVTLKKSGVNTIRLRLWKNPSSTTSNFETVKSLTQEIQNMGMKVMLTVHYSDTWADPSQQLKPEEWKFNNFSQLLENINLYTRRIATEIHPDYIQIGNEINNGFLWNEGHINNSASMKMLLEKAVSAIRSTQPEIKIIIQYAGYEGAFSFFNLISSLDYDIIGISYYPLWHGKDLSFLQQSLEKISNTQNKPIFIAETSYPFTFDWNDNTHNIIGNASQILPEYPATENGQKQYLEKIKNLISQVPKGIGFCYWGGEWISYKGRTSTQGSSYENQAFYDFNHKALPILDVYQ